MDCRERVGSGMAGRGVVLGHQSWGIKQRPRVASAHLILLGELEAVVGFESLHVLGHVCDGNGRVAKHTCEERSGHMVSGSAAVAMEALWLKDMTGGQDGPVPPATQLEDGKKVNSVQPWSPCPEFHSPSICGKGGEAEAASVVQKHSARGATLPKIGGPSSCPSGSRTCCVHV